MPKLQGPATDPRIETQFIVTEHGICDVRGKSSAERAMGLIAIADPAANAAAVLGAARECDARGAAVAVFPELALSAYSVEDLLLRISWLVETVAEIAEMDANPVKVMEPGRGLALVDVRVYVRAG